MFDFDFVAIDWGHNDGKSVAFDGDNFSTKLPVPTPNLILLTENIPAKYAKEYIEAGSKVLRCSTHAIIPLREERQKQQPDFDKSDENDAELIWDLFQEKPNAFREMSLKPKIGICYDIFKAFQKERIRIGNQLYADMTDEMVPFFNKTKEAEELLKKVVDKYLKEQPIYTLWLSKIKGFGGGTSLAAGLISLIGDISRFNSVSGMWAYFGYAVIDGKIQKKKKGEVANWEQDMKVLCHNILDSFIKQRTPVYRGIYDNEKAKQLANGIKPGHANNRAKRKTAKIFLQHYWVVAREIAGLPVSNPWVIEHGGHTDLIKPPFWFGMPKKMDLPE